MKNIFVFLVIFLLLTPALLAQTSDSDLTAYQLIGEVDEFIEHSKKMLNDNEMLFSEFSEFMDNSTELYHLTQNWLDIVVPQMTDEKYAENLKNNIIYGKDEVLHLVYRLNKLLSQMVAIEKAYEKGPFKSTFSQNYKLLLAAGITGMYALNKPWQDFEKDPAHDSKPWGVSLKMPLTEKLFISMGHFQGLAGLVNYRLARSFSLGSMFFYADMNVSGGVVFNGDKNNMFLRKGILGVTFAKKFFDTFEMEFGVYKQRYFNSKGIENSEGYYRRSEFLPRFSLQFTL